MKMHFILLKKFLICKILCKSLFTPVHCYVLVWCVKSHQNSVRFVVVMQQNVKKVKSCEYFFAMLGYNQL